MSSFTLTWAICCCCWCRNCQAREERILLPRSFTSIFRKARERIRFGKQRNAKPLLLVVIAVAVVLHAHGLVDGRRAEQVALPASFHLEGDEN